MKKISKVLVICILTGIIMLFSSLIVFAETTNDEGVVGTTNLNGNTENSAKVGDRLVAPEIGWKRYDDTNINITYGGGTWTHRSNYLFWNSLYSYNKTDTYSSPQVGTYMKFNFVGTKLRFLTITSNATSTEGPDNIEIKIDGVIEGNATAYRQNNVSCLLFEKTGLSVGEHYVEITTRSIKNGSSCLNPDAIDIDSSGYLLPYSVKTHLVASINNSHISLAWDAVDGATGYNVKRSITAGGPYTTIVSNVTGTSYTDSDVTAGTTYYYVVTAITSSGESANSNEASANLETPVVTGNSAILEITMTDGTIKEYDMTGAELDTFLKWYDDRSNGTGKSYFTITKKYNIKPFLSRKEYLPFDKIFNFEVKEYKDN